HGCIVTQNCDFSVGGFAYPVDQIVTIRIVGNETLQVGAYPVTAIAGFTPVQTYHRITGGLERPAQCAAYDSGATGNYSGATTHDNPRNRNS
ncbi:MAG: hypothetical protein MJA32_12575, partial [Proteobacteria bacterium]|nr:hypothetical protein [Pseudomonadota bacterium]